MRATRCTGQALPPNKMRTAVAPRLLVFPSLYVVVLFLEQYLGPGGMGGGMKEKDGFSAASSSFLLLQARNGEGGGTNCTRSRKVIPSKKSSLRTT